jgi:hypothetical protein
LTIEPFVENTGGKMARYSALLGRSVEVQYRAGDICLPAAGTLVADSGRSIFLEQHYEQRGQPKNFRWEVPYAYIVRIEEKPPADAVPAKASRGVASSPDTEDAAHESETDTPQASAARAAGGGGGLLPFANRPKTA